MNQNQMTECNRCKGNACYEQKINDDVTTWLCMGCGFTTSSLMTKDGKPLAEIKDTSPELYKDLLFEDKNGLTWAPCTITLPMKGMVFIDGKTAKDWRWSAVKAIKLTEEEITSGRFPKDQSYKMDMNGARLFEQKEFMDALEVIGFYDVKQ